ncbi:riboflavin biosynthesis protein RibF [bacterium]|jgi:riboflavin kinase / FMN adenylyltransferase|nr:riboflavin biosynthesis protein RibF [bacterium]
MKNLKVYGSFKKGEEILGLGVFDGLHLGHQEILKVSTSLLTFFPHPLMALKKRQVPNLTSLDELRTYVDSLLVIRFSKVLAGLSALEFLEAILWDQIRPKHIVVGYDFKFGNRQKGDIYLLEKWTKVKGIRLTVVDAVSHQNTVVKSSKIRALFQDGSFEDAINLIGHSYLIKGMVIKGEGRGRKIGFPTANIKVNSIKLLPKPGVYSGHVFLKRKKFAAMIYIGNKPTFNGTYSSVEVHIVGGVFSLYNRKLAVYLCHQIRGEVKFSSAAELVSQIKKDIAKASKNVEK